MFITSEDHRFFSKLSSEDHEDIAWSGGGGSSSSSEDDRRATSIQGSSGSFANSVGLLPALPETSSSSSDFSSKEDEPDDSEREDSDRIRLYPNSESSQKRIGILRRSALDIFTGGRRRRCLYSDSSESPSKTQNHNSISDIDIQPPPPLPFLPSEPNVAQEVTIPHDSTNPMISTELSVVPEEDDLQSSDRKSDEMMSQSSIEHMLYSATQNSEQNIASTTSSRDSYSLHSHGGSRSRSKVERKKKKKSHRTSSFVQSSTLNDAQDETHILHMEEELEARLHVIKHLKDTVVKQHEAMEQLSKSNNKLKAKLRIAEKSYKASQVRLHEDALRIQCLEMELNTLKLKIDQLGN